MSAALIAKLESASEGSRELDCRVLEAVTPAEADGSTWQAVQWDEHWFFALFAKGVEPAPKAWMVIAQEQRVTTSIDAALALAERCLPGWFWSARKNVTTGYLATLFALNEPPWTGSAYEKMEQGRANTPALAICAAILRASAAQGAGHD